MIMGITHPQRRHFSTEFQPAVANFRKRKRRKILILSLSFLKMRVLALNFALLDKNCSTKDFLTIFQQLTFIF